MPTIMRHREKVLAHAEQQLRSQGNLNSAELLQLYKKFLKIENHRIWLKHRAGGGGREICAERAHLVDIVLAHLLDAAIEGRDKPIAGVRLSLVAIGGYGRGELNPFSDVDIMFLHPDASQAEAEGNKIVEQILYLLWDVGFKVGHSTRSVSAAIEQANVDMLSKTSLLEARLIAGDQALFDQFRDTFLKRCVAGHEAEYIRQRVENQAERHAKFGQTVYLQEPNIKNSCGGLRDYQNVLWMSFFKSRTASTADLVKKGLLNESERRHLDRAYDFLLRVRTELHYFNKRAADTIHLNQQLQLANRLNYTQKNILRRSEAFMRDYYQNARTIYHTTELLADRMSLASKEPAKRPGLLSIFRKTKVSKVEHFDGFCSIGDRIYPEQQNLFTHEPARLMRLFQHMQQRQLRLSPELTQRVRRRLHLVDRTFQYSTAARETFIAICSRKGKVGWILRAMHEADFLGRYMPEFGQLTCLVQHEFFHRYTADEHTLVCIEKLDRVIDTTDPKLAEYRKIFEKLEDPFVLYLALLLHDTGKAANVKLHAEASALYAQKVARRLQLTPERRKSLVLLVDHHITLSSTAQRRNLDDPATIAEFADIVKSQANLDALMLLTLADGQGTADEKWGDWKEGLVWQLYRSTSSYLADGEAFYRQRAVEREAMHGAVSKKLPADYAGEIDAHFQYMPERYFQAYHAAEIVEHVRLFRRFLETRLKDDTELLAPAVKWIARPDRGHSEFWFCGWDRTELLARIAGCLSVAQMNILSADVFTRADSLVLDIFRVCNTRFEAVTDEKEMALVEKRLRQSLAGETFDFTPLLAKLMRRRGYHLSEELDFPTRISVDNEEHPVYTLVDIQTPDRLGLLHHLLCAFGSSGVQIAISRIATEKGAAIDSFYVTEMDGRKLRPATVTRVQKALQNAAEGGELKGQG